MTKWLQGHQIGLSWPKNIQNDPQHINFCSVRGTNRSYIRNQPLSFHQVVLSKVTRAQEGIPTSQSGLNWPKNAQNHSKMSRSALSGDLTATTLTTNHSIFNKRPSKCYEGSRRHSQIHDKVASHPQKRPELAKKHSKQITKYQILLCEGIQLV